MHWSNLFALANFHPLPQANTRVNLGVRKVTLRIFTLPCVFTFAPLVRIMCSNKRGFAEGQPILNLLFPLFVLSCVQPPSRLGKAGEQYMLPKQGT